MMTREDTKQMLPIIQTYADGKVIEHYNEETQTWIECGEFGYKFNDASMRYRVKSEPEYVPFTSYEECWNEMMRHSYLGWLEGHKSRVLIVRVQRGCVVMVNENMDIEKHCFDYMIENYKFIDGTPFGKLKE